MWVKRTDKIIFSEARSFPKETLAGDWAARLELDLKGHGAIEKRKLSLGAISGYQRSGIAATILRSVPSALCGCSWVITQIGDLALQDPGHAHRLHLLVDLAGGDAIDSGVLIGDQNLLDQTTRLQERREIAALSQLGRRQFLRTDTTVPDTVTVAVAIDLPEPYP